MRTLRLRRADHWLAEVYGQGYGLIKFEEYEYLSFKENQCLHIGVEPGFLPS